MIIATNEQNAWSWADTFYFYTDLNCYFTGEYTYYRLEFACLHTAEGRNLKE